MRRTRSWSYRLRRFALGHWRGDFAPARSLWLHHLLPASASAIVLAMLAAATSVDARDPRTGALAFLALWPAALALHLWGAVGAWRAAQPWGPTAGRPIVLMSMRALVVAAALASSAMAVVQHGPHTWRSLRWLAGPPAQGRATLDRSADGRRLLLHGALGVGDAERLMRGLDAAAAPRVLELDSPGGRYPEAALLASRLRGRGWTTRVGGECRNACMLLFLAGERRQRLPGGRLGFNREGTEHASPLVRWLAQRRLKALLAGAGLDPVFVLKAASTPSATLWQPGVDELLGRGLLTRPERPLDLELPPAATAVAADYADALRAQPLWQLLESRSPGAVDDALLRLRHARVAGADDEALQAAAQQGLEPLRTRLLYNASPALREPYLRLLAEQITAAPDAPACRRLLGGDAAVLRSLPSPLQEREVEWLLDATLEPPREVGPRRANGAEQEVIRRTLGAHAPGALARLRRPAAGDLRACDRTAALLSQVLALPPAERKLALRLAFEGS